MNDLFGITSALFIAFIGAEIAQRFGHSRVIGQLIIGLILGIPLIRTFLFTESSIHVIEIFSELGIIFLMLLTGFEVDIKKFLSNKYESTIIALFGFIVPFTIGYLLVLFLGYGALTASIVGASLAISAEGITAALLIDLKKIKTKVGSILLGAGIIDDLLGILFFSGILIFIDGKNVNIDLIPLKIIGMVTAIILAFLLIPKIIRAIEKEHKEASLFNVVLLIGLILAISTQLVGLGSILGAFIAGVILQNSFMCKTSKKEEINHLSVFAFAFILPFFFIYTGINFDFLAIIKDPSFALLILVAAIIGKILGVFITKPFVNLKTKQLHLIGWGMNSRGVIELVLANFALAHGLINRDLYSAIVFMTIITTITFPFVFKRMIKRNPGIME
jgi:Kef-type K+ transport system membrane component KefB